MHVCTYVYDVSLYIYTHVYMLCVRVFAYLHICFFSLCVYVFQSTRICMTQIRLRGLPYEAGEQVHRSKGFYLWNLS